MPQINTGLFSTHNRPSLFWEGVGLCVCMELMLIPQQQPSCQKNTVSPYDTQHALSDGSHWRKIGNIYNSVHSTSLKSMCNCEVVCYCRGRFGQVHKCAELSSGLMLAAKMIKVRGMKERVSTQIKHYCPSLFRVCLGLLSHTLSLFLSPLPLQSVHHSVPAMLLYENISLTTNDRPSHISMQKQSTYLHAQSHIT